MCFTSVDGPWYSIQHILGYCSLHTLFELLFLLWVVSAMTGVDEHPDYWHFEQVPSLELCQRILKSIYKAGNLLN